MKRIFGFTITELLIVIIVVGVLGAIAIPKFFELQADNQKTEIKNLAEVLNKANTANIAARKGKPKKGVAITNCQDITKTLPESLPPGYSIKSEIIPVGSTIDCELDSPNKLVSKFKVTGIS